VATAAPKRRTYNFEQFCAMIPEGVKADLLDGVIYVASPDNLEHLDISGWLYRLMCDYIDAHDLGGHVYQLRAAFRLDEANAPEPDLAYVLSERAFIHQRTFINGSPDLVIEIVSSDSVERDYRKKYRQYERFGVSEYWIIDPLERKMTCYRLGKDGRYREARPRKGVFASRVIPGFWVRSEWFWALPMFKEKDVLKEILASAGK
jgi:Uma2 family endonuclease